MPKTLGDILHPRSDGGDDAAFPHAPAEWTPQSAQRLARDEGIELGEDHWEAVRALQEFCARRESTDIKARRLHDALEERFHSRGGMRYLYLLFPQGPVAQGCRIAGLKPPAGARDLGFGSVQ